MATYQSSIHAAIQVVNLQLRLLKGGNAELTA